MPFKAIHFRPLLFGLLAAWLPAALSQGDPLRLIEPQNSRVREIVASADGGLWLRLSRGIGPGREQSLLRISEELRLQQRSRLPDGILSMARFGPGLLIQRVTNPPGPPDRQEFQLLFLDDDGSDRSRVVYSRTGGDYDGRFDFAPAPGAEAIYVAEQVDRHEYAIRRLDTTGTEIWSRLLVETQVRNLAATAQGPVVAHLPTRAMNGRTRSLRLTAYTPAGDPRWESDTEVESGRSVLEFAGLPPNRLALLPQMRRNEVGSLVIVDNASGLLVSEVPLPRVPYRRRAPAFYPTNDGLIMATELIGHSYVAHLGPDGETQWWRRFRINESSRDRSEVRPLADGRLAIVSIVRAEPRQEERITLVFVDPQSRMFAETYGRCLETDPMPIVALEQDLFERYGVRVELPLWRDETDNRSGPVDTCVAPTEAAYREFLETFIDELDRRSAPRWDYWNEALSVYVVNTEQPYELEQYDLGGVASDGPNSSFSYRVNPGAGRALARHVAEELWPHFRATLATLRNDFYGRTGHLLMAYASRPADAQPVVFMRRIEAAVARIIAQVDLLSDDELATLQSKRGTGGFFFNTDGFGRDYEDIRPLDEIGDELRAEIDAISEQQARESPPRPAPSAGSPPYGPVDTLADPSN